MSCEVPIIDPALNLPVDQTEYREEFGYYSNDLDTHPIDYVRQQQGWGPFNGAWSPLDFASGRDTAAGYYGIDTTWYAGDAKEQINNYAPPLYVYTLMSDRSLSLVGNLSQPPVSIVSGASTIRQAGVLPQPTVTVPSVSATVSFLQTLRDWFTGGNS